MTGREIYWITIKFFQNQYIKYGNPYYIILCVCLYIKSLEYIFKMYANSLEMTIYNICLCFKEVSYAYQASIYLIKNTEKKCNFVKYYYNSKLSI